MKLIRSINLLENKKVIIWLNVVSIILLFLFFIVFGLLALALKPDLSLETSSISELVILGISCFVTIIVHELIHGFFFKVFNQKGKVKFGFKSGMAYATSPNSYYNKMQFLIIALAPFVLITSCLIILYYLNIVSAIFFVIVAAFHACGCVGDFYYVYLLTSLPKHIMVEDTEVGINFYSSES